MIIEIWKSKNKNSHKAVILRSATWWMLYWKNVKLHWDFKWNRDPSRLHANIQLLLLGFTKCNGRYTFRVLNQELSFYY